MDKLNYVKLCRNLIIYKMIINFHSLVCRVTLASSVFISIISILLVAVFNLPAIFVFNPNSYSLSDSRLTAAFQLNFPSQYVDHFHDVEVVKKSSRHSTEFELEALKSLEAALEVLKQGKIERAQKLFEHALALSPKQPDILNNYGEFMEYTQKDIIHADHLYFKAITNSPGHSRAILNHGRLAEVVEEMDLTTLKRIDKKRDSVASIPEANSALRKAKLEAYFQFPRVLGSIERDAIQRRENCTMHFSFIGDALFQHIYHTVGIEGNTLTLSQTRSVVETKMAIGGKSIVEHNEILGLDAALKFINTTLINRIGHITVADILEIHRRVLGYVDPLEAGTLRRTQVFVGGHIPPPPSNIPPLMEKFEKWLNSWEAMRLHPVKYAALAHYKLVYLHPFNDGNGRTSRLLMDTILMQAGYPPVIILKQERHRYYRMIELANEGDIRPFVRYIAECTERTLDLFIWSTSEFSSELPALASEMTQSIPVDEMQDLDRSMHLLSWHNTSLQLLCRLCANTNDYLIPIFRGEGIDYQLQLKISQHLNVEITEEDSLPTQVCYPCASTLLAFHEMIENYVEAEKRLNSFLSLNRLKNPVKALETENYFTEQYHDLGGNSCSNNSGENVSIDDANVYKYKQPVKKRLLVENERLLNLETVEKLIKKPEKEENVTNSYSVVISSPEIKDYKDKKKKRKKREKLSKCSICGKVFHFVEYLKSHLLSHSDHRPHLCHICGASFKRKDHVNHHRRTVHLNHPDIVKELEQKGEEPLECDECGELKPTKYAMLVHKKRHNVNCVCDVCQKSFPLPSHLKTHMVKEHPEELCTCDICGEVLKSGHALYIHKKKHLTSYICDVCGKSFTQPSSLRTHMVIHSDDKPFTCDECGKSFKLKVRLQLHKQSHGNFRPYACSICENKRFKTKTALIVHNNMHNDTRPYPCPHCSFRARKNSDLVCHIRTHTGEKPYKCDVCGRGFAQAGDMRKHRSTHNRQKLEPL